MALSSHDITGEGTGQPAPMDTPTSGVLICWPELPFMTGALSRSLRPRPDRGGLSSSWAGSLGSTPWSLLCWTEFPGPLEAALGGCPLLGPWPSLALKVWLCGWHPGSLTRGRADNCPGPPALMVTNARGEPQRPAGAAESCLAWRPLPTASLVVSPSECVSNP